MGGTKGTFCEDHGGRGRKGWATRRGTPGELADGGGDRGRDPHIPEPGRRRDVGPGRALWGREDLTRERSRAGGSAAPRATASLPFPASQGGPRGAGQSGVRRTVCEGLVPRRVPADVKDSAVSQGGQSEPRTTVRLS